MKLQGAPSLAIAPDVLFQEVGGEVVLLNLADESYFGLDTTGARIWQLLAEGRDIGELQQILMDEFEVEPDVLQADLSRLLAELTEAGLLVEE
jgi:hypothetical protein